MKWKLKNILNRKNTTSWKKASTKVDYSIEENDVIEKKKILDSEKLELLIEEREFDLCKIELIDFLRDSPWNEDALSMLSRCVEPGYRTLVLYDLLRLDPANQDCLNEIMRYEFEAFLTRETCTLEVLQFRLQRLFLLIKGEMVASVILSISEKIEEEYKKNPLIGRDLALASFRSLAESSEKNALQFFCGLKKNLRDIRIERSAYFCSKRRGNLCLSLDLLNSIEDDDEREFERISILSSILDILLVESDEGRWIGLILGSSFQQYSEEGAILKIIEYLARFSKSIEEIIGENGIEREMELGGILDLLRTEIGEGGEDLFSEMGQFTPNLASDLSLMPLNFIRKRIELFLSENDSLEIFEDSINRCISEINPTNHRLVEILQSTCSVLISVKPEMALSFIKDAVETFPEDERLTRQMARCYEKNGEIEKAIEALESCSQPSSIELIDRFREMSEILENGIILETIPMSEKNDPILGKMMYNVHSSLPYVTSGYTIRTEAVSKALQGAGIDVVVNCRWGFPTDKYQEINSSDVEIKKEINGIQHIFSPDEDGMRIYRFRDYCQRVVEDLGSKILDVRPSVIMSASDYSIGLPSAHIANEFGIPFIYEMRGIWAYSRSANNPGYEGSTQYKILMRLEKQCAELASMVVVISNEMKKILIDWGIDSEKIVTLTNGTEKTNEKKKINSIKNIQKSKEDSGIVFGYVGSIVPYEGIDTLLEAFAELIEENGKGMRLQIVGDGSARETLEQLSFKLGISDSVNFLGRVEHSSIDSIYEEIDCIVIPRKPYLVCETVPPLKPLEAMKFGKIVLMSDVSPARELILDGVNGFLFKKGDVKSLSEKLREISVNLENYREIGISSSEWVRENRTWSGVSRELIDCVSLFFLKFLANNRNPNIERIGLEIEEKYGEEIFDKVKSRLIINKMENLDFSDLEIRNVFLALFRSIGKLNNRAAIEFGEGLLEKYGDHRSRRSMVTFLNRDGRYRESLKIVNSNKWNDDLWKREMVAELNKRIQREAFGRGVETEDGNFSLQRIESELLRTIGYETLISEPKDRILIYGDINLNIVDGSSIWLSSISELFSKTGREIHLLTKANLESGILTDHLRKIGNIRIFQPSDFGINGLELNPSNASKLISILDGVYGGYKCIVIRGYEICKNIGNEKNLWKRVWAYLTDYYSITELNGRQLKSDAREFLLDFKHFCGKFIVQTEEILQDMRDLAEVPLEQFIIVPPMLPDYFSEIGGYLSRSGEKNRKLKIGYIGKIAPMWGVDTLIRELNKIPNVEEKVEVTIVGSKFNRNTPDRPNFIEETKFLLENSEFVNWIPSVPREEAVKILKGMDLSWCYRSKKLERETLEVSTKLLESSRLGIPPILIEGRINSKVFSESYPLLLRGDEDIVPIINSVLEDFKIIEEARKDLPDTTGNRMENILVERIMPVVKEYEMPQGKNIVFNGHDMKFVGEFESFLKICGHCVRRDNWGWGEAEDKERSESLSKWGEIILSEWGLANAVWYSRNIDKKKTHVIRIHLQEINQRARKFPREIDLDYVDNIVVVAEHVRKEAVELFSWEEACTEVIPNLVDVKRLDRPRKSGIGRTLGIVGIVPQRKRVDRTLDLITNLSNESGEEWQLIIKGKLPHELAFMHGPSRKKELEYYQTQYDRIKREKSLSSSVSFEGYTPTIASFYSKADFVLSPSDFESFHFTIADGVSSGSIPIIWPWDGSTEIYPEDWVVGSTEEATQRILEIIDMDDEELDAMRMENKKYIQERFGLERVFNGLFESMGLEIPEERLDLITFRGSV